MNAPPPVQQANPDVHPLDWQDDFGPCKYTEFGKFVSHMQRIERLQSDPAAQSALCRELGYADEPHFQRVRTTFLKYWGDPDGNEHVKDFIWKEPEFSQAIMDGMQIERQEQAQRALAQNPGLLAPIEGVTLEQYADLCSRIAGRQVSPQELMQLIAPLRLDVAGWQRVNQGWIARMQGDATGTVTGAYAKAFTDASTRAAGGEPMTLDLYSEICVAMGAWAKQGKDSSTMLQQTFGVEMSKFVAAGAYWGAKMSTDMAVLGRYTQLQESLKSKYETADADSDLKL
jgi:hypothetical protein